MTKAERDMARALRTINNLVFATCGMPLDSHRYFRIRGLCVDTLRKHDIPCITKDAWEKRKK